MKGPSNKKQPKKGLPVRDQHKQYQKPINQVKKIRYTELVVLAIIILLGIKIYSNSFDCSFHLDDSRFLDNTSIHNLADVKSWSKILPTRPFGTFTFALNYHFNQLDVKYYHLVNLIIHLITACLIWWLTLLILSSPAIKDQPIARNKNVIAFFTALLFVSHPLATQSVTYIIQRLTSMAAMFYLLSLALYMKGRLANNRNISTYLFFTGSLVAGVLAMLTKENAFSLPFAILLVELFFIRTKKLSINFRDYRVILSIIALLGIIILILLLFSSHIFKPIPPVRYGNAYTVTPLNYFFTQFSVIVKYIQLLFLPINQNVDYDFPISNTFFEIRTLLSFIVLLSLIVLAILSFKRYRIISFGIFWFFLTLLIESSFIPLNDLIFEHRTYLPSFGFFLILTSGIYLLLWKKYNYLAITIFIAIIGLNSYLTYERNKVWKDDLSLWSDVVSKSPKKVRPLYNLGVAYSTLGQWDKAIDVFSNALQIDAKNTDCYYNRGVSYANLNQWDKAIADFSKAIQIDKNLIYAYYNRGVAYGHLGQLDNAIADYSMVIKIDPKHKDAYSNLGIIYCNLGQWDKALVDYSMLIGIDPNNADAYCNRGVAYATVGQLEKAIADFSRALEINPNNANAYSNRENAYGKLRSNKK